MNGEKRYGEGCGEGTEDGVGQLSLIKNSLSNYMPLWSQDPLRRAAALMGSVSEDESDH